DLETARAMLKAGRYLYVGFMCHQTIEKSLKAYYWHSIQNEPPYTHNLLILAEQSNLIQYVTDPMNRLLSRLMPLNIQARYPQDKDELLRVLSDSVCSDILKQTEEFFEWINQLLKK
ncbi:MAG TPA: HEPN domain-containing protein, partial [Spirochaetota bacterium]|nr:HEPN domain-containing protein [Spirochaetota bacterium]